MLCYVCARSIHFKFSPEQNKRHTLRPASFGAWNITMFSNCFRMKLCAWCPMFCFDDWGYSSVSATVLKKVFFFKFRNCFFIFHLISDTGLFWDDISVCGHSVRFHSRSPSAESNFFQYWPLRIQNAFVWDGKQIRHIIKTSSTATICFDRSWIFLWNAPARSFHLSNDNRENSTTLWHGISANDPVHVRICSVCMGNILGFG